MHQGDQKQEINKKMGIVYVVHIISIEFDDSTNSVSKNTETFYQKNFVNLLY